MLANTNVERIRQPQRDPADPFAADVIEGLSQAQKTLPCRYFYDARGSDLFEQITALPEYYPTRTETGILTENAAQMMRDFPKNGVLVEFGSGSSRKTELLLRELPVDATYVAIDVSLDALRLAGARLVQRFPRLDVRLVVGDFSELAQLPIDLVSRPKIGFFPGSTIGNLVPADAIRLFQRFRSLLPYRSRLVVGVDLKKDIQTLLDAYNDKAGVTAAFNMNLLARVNREIEPVFDISAFAHESIYNPREGRIEMHLISRRDQILAVSGRRFVMRAGETIHTENSYKYTVRQFQTLARRASWKATRVWKDPADLFSVHELQ